MGGFMNIPRLTAVTLGVTDLSLSTKFYAAVLATSPNTSYEGVAFFELPGTWISLYPLEDLAKDISPEVPTTRSGFSGITLAHNARSREDVIAIVGRAELAGARVVKAPQETFWGGFSGYFADPDGYYWEVVWGPMFEFTENGELRFKAST
jgi:predicted lactoylglutathione lyase